MENAGKAIAVSVAGLALCAALGLGLSGCIPVTVSSDKPIHIVLEVVHRTAMETEDQVEGKRSEPKRADQSGPVSSAPRFSHAVYTYEWTESVLLAADDRTGAKDRKTSPDVEKAIASRKARFDEIAKEKASAAIGENNQGMLETRDSAPAMKQPESAARIKDLVAKENADRLVIYKGTIEDPSIDLSPDDLIKVQRVWAKVHRDRAKTGEWVQAPDEKANYDDFIKSELGRKLKDKPKTGEWFQVP